MSEQPSHTRYQIQGGQPLKGKIKVAGNKNAVLPMMAASLLTQEECVLENVPQIKDVEVMAKILEKLGAKVTGIGTSRLKISSKKVSQFNLEPNLVQQLRASILFLGPLLARFQKAKMVHPGGCIVGRRAIGTHFDILRKFGAEIMVGNEDYEAEAKKLHPADIFLDEASVTATENALMLAASQPGVTIIRNAACEPHVICLSQFLEKMGASIEGIGTNVLKIIGQEKLKGTNHRVSPDHIEIGTLMIAAAATSGKLVIEDVIPDHLRMILLYLSKMGVKYQLQNNSLIVFPSKLKAPSSKIQTRPWPGFPTDLMSPLIVLATQAQGLTLCHDWMYEGRMFFVDKLIQMGAKIIVCDPHRVVVQGQTPLQGKELETPDIRAGIALMIAALCARGESTINRAELIERGYENIAARLNSLGAKIEEDGKE